MKTGSSPFKFQIPSNWRVSKNLRINDDATMIIKAESDSSSILVGVTDYYTERIRKEAKTTRAQLAAMMEQHNEELFKPIVDKICSDRHCENRIRENLVPIESVTCDRESTSTQSQWPGNHPVGEVSQVRVFRHSRSTVILIY